MRPHLDTTLLTPCEAPRLQADATLVGNVARPYDATRKTRLAYHFKVMGFPPLHLLGGYGVRKARSLQLLITRRSWGFPIDPRLFDFRLLPELLLPAADDDAGFRVCYTRRPATALVESLYLQLCCRVLFSSKEDRLKREKGKRLLWKRPREESSDTLQICKCTLLRDISRRCSCLWICLHVGCESSDGRPSSKCLRTLECLHLGDCLRLRRKCFMELPASMCLQLGSVLFGTLTSGIRMCSCCRVKRLLRYARGSCFCLNKPPELSRSNVLKRSLHASAAVNTDSGPPMQR